MENMTTVKEEVTLPSDWLERGDFQDGNLIVQRQGNVATIWFVVPRPVKSFEWIEMGFNNIPGTKPVAGMFNEWNPSTGTPMFALASPSLVYVLRGQDAVRMKGQSNWGADIIAAFGLIYII